MGGYLANFAIYTMAMIGLIFFALMVYKKCSGFGNIGQSKNRTLSVEETISIAPRKTLYVVRAGNERFLIAGDVDKTTLISKLGNVSEDCSKVEDSNVKKSTPEVRPQNTKLKENETVQPVRNTQRVNSSVAQTANSVDDLPVIVDFQNRVKSDNNVLHNMLRKMNG